MSIVNFKTFIFDIVIYFELNIDPYKYCELIEYIEEIERATSDF